MTARLQAQNSPNLLVMRYDRGRASVSDLIVVPGAVFTPAVIERRKPLASTARRAGWVGCNILLGEVPEAGKVALIREGAALPKAEVLARFRETLFLRRAGAQARGWLIEVLKAVERIASPAFTLDDVYASEAHLARLYPGNNNLRPKIRQQLQAPRRPGADRVPGAGTVSAAAGGLRPAARVCRLRAACRRARARQGALRSSPLTRPARDGVLMGSGRWASLR